jgi:hypothetical protein
MRRKWGLKQAGIATLMGALVGLGGLGGEALAQCAGGNCAGGYSGIYAGSNPVTAQDSFAAMYGSRVQPLFNNYFTQGYANQAEAAMYISPVGVPGWVGHTYNTYQPFYPHELMHWHRDRYHSYYDDGRGLNRTSAHYYSPPVRTVVNRAHKFLEIPR